MEKELALILEMLPKLKWEVQVADASATGDPTAKFYLGTAPGWRVTVVSFDIEPQGFPPGSRGYDGAASHSSKLVHLTRELAERAFKLAAGTE